MFEKNISNVCVIGIVYIPVYLCGMSLSNTTFNLIIDFPGVTMKLKISS